MKLLKKYKQRVPRKLKKELRKLAIEQTPLYVVPSSIRVYLKKGKSNNITQKVRLKLMNEVKKQLVLLKKRFAENQLKDISS